MSSGRTKGSGLEWFVRRGTAVRGPFSSSKVRHFVLEETLDLDDEVSADRQQWRRLGSVPEVVPLQMRTDDSVAAAEQDAERRGERVRATRAIVVTLLVIVGLTAGVSFVGQQPADITRDCASAPAPGVFLEGCKLAGAQMAGASLVGAHMANTSLSGAKLSEADLTQADLRYANLGGADLSYAKLIAADLKGANLTSADLTNALLDGADLSFADFGGARLGGASFKESNLEGAIWTDGKSCGAADCPR
jgi:hypothetical protein